MKPESQSYLDKAHQSLAHGRAILSIDLGDDAGRAAYLAALHAAQALIFEATGRVAKLLIGQGYGFIRLANERDIFFHRADLQEGTVFNDLRTGDTVTFELFEDSVSGARALYVSARNRK